MEWMLAGWLRFEGSLWGVNSGGENMSGASVSIRRRSRGTDLKASRWRVLRGWAKWPEREK